MKGYMEAAMPLSIFLRVFWQSVNDVGCCGCFVIPACGRKRERALANLVPVSRVRSLVLREMLTQHSHNRATGRDSRGTRVIGLGQIIGWPASLSWSVHKLQTMCTTDKDLSGKSVINYATILAVAKFVKLAKSIEWPYNELNSPKAKFQTAPEVTNSAQYTCWTNSKFPI